MSSTDDKQDNPSDTENKVEVVVQLSREIDAITNTELEPSDESLQNLLADFSAAAVGASPEVLNEIDVLLADDAFHGSIYDDSGAKIVWRMDRGLQAAILRGADNAVQAMFDAAAEPEPLAEIFDELDTIPSNDEPVVQQVSDQQASATVSARRRAADNLGEIIRGIEYGEYLPSDTKVVAIEIGRLIKEAQVTKKRALDGIVAAVSHARLSRESKELDSGIAAGITKPSPQPDWDGLLRELRKVLKKT